MSILVFTKRYGNELGEAAALFRSLAVRIEQNPQCIVDYVDSPGNQLLLNDDSRDCLKKAKLYEALAYGDTGCVFASPRPCLSGLLLNEIGTQAQQIEFHDYVKSAKATTCFAVTEPLHGSDAANIETSVMAEANHDYKLNGEKWLFGNGISAKIGIVVAKSHRGLLGMQPVVVRLEKNSTVTNIQREALPMLGLKAAQLSRVNFMDFPIEANDLLGLKINPMQKGLMALMKTFNKMRVCIAALAIGHCFAIIDYIREHRLQLTQSEVQVLEEYEVKALCLRQQIHQVAEHLKHNPTATQVVAHVKLQATKLIEEVATKAWGFFGAGSFMEHPYLEKSYRDAFSYEYADGTTHIQYQHIYQSYRHGTFKPNL